MDEQERSLAQKLHHTRRPMNAFLIFCKRHRSIVRDKYPHLENRSITKILGEWWTSLEENEKSCFTDLAKQYKDAFFDANPDFKWYKLPAPPLRTTPARPRESLDKSDTNVLPASLFEKTNNNSTKVDLNKSILSKVWSHKTLSTFSPSKLADMDQMGGLSCLIEMKTDVKNFHAISPNISYGHLYGPSRTQIQPNVQHDNINQLQSVLSETSKLFKGLDEGPNIASNNIITPNTSDAINEIVKKRYSTDESDSVHSKWFDDDDKKPERLCKGKKYIEFMAEGLKCKKQKRDPKDMGGDNELYQEYTSRQSFEESNVNPTRSVSESSEPTECETDAGLYNKSSDFDLDSKIRALPSLCLEKFQQKKREKKRKKRPSYINPKSSRCVEQEPMNKMESQSFSCEVISGSQKRKPRKRSITKLDLYSVAAAEYLVESQRGGTPATMPGRCVYTSNVDIKGEATCSDAGFFALATLAEIAANTSKIVDEHTSK